VRERGVEEDRWGGEGGGSKTHVLEIRLQDGSGGVVDLSSHATDTTAAGETAAKFRDLG
jgi:hypothetical protein